MHRRNRYNLCEGETVGDRKHFRKIKGWEVSKQLTLKSPKRTKVDNKWGYTKQSKDCLKLQIEHRRTAKNGYS